MRITASLVLALALGLGSAAAEDKQPPNKPKPLTEEQAADAVLAAVKAKDDKALEAVAEREPPDPWIVADVLCYRGEHDAADAFAKAFPRRAIEKLPAYIASQRGKEPNEAVRKALAFARANRNARVRMPRLESVDVSQDDVVTVQLHFMRGGTLRALRRLKESAAAYLAGADIAGRLGWYRVEALAMHHGGLSASNCGDLRGALAAWTRCLKLCEANGDRSGMARTLVNLGTVQLPLGKIDEALASHERGLELAEALGHRQWAVNALMNLGGAHLQRGAYEKALGYLARALEGQEALKNRAGMAGTLINMGAAYERLAKYEQARDHLERGLRLAEQVGQRQYTVNALGNLGRVHAQLGNYQQALQYSQRMLGLSQALRYRGGVASALAGIGLTHRHFGDYVKARDHLQRALAIHRTIGNPQAIAFTLDGLGIVHQNLGEFAKAQSLHEQALELAAKTGNRQLRSSALGNLGVVHDRLGNYEQALRDLQAALELAEELGDRSGAATVQGNIGVVHKHRGEPEEALRCEERALELQVELKDRARQATTLGNIGNLHVMLGDPEKARGCYEKALALCKDVGDCLGEARTLGNLGSLHGSLGDHVKAIELQEEALAKAKERGATNLEVAMLWHLATAHGRNRNPAETVRLARQGVARLPLVVGGLEEEQGATARDRWVGLLDDGVRGGLDLDSPAEVSFFMESGRAGVLLESLGGRAALATVVLPETLLAEETAARASVAAARAKLGRTLALQQFKQARTARKEFLAAEQSVLEVVAKIQRASKAAADVAYPEAADLETIQATLEGGEALVTYALLPERAVALIVTSKTARIIELGETKRIEKVARALTLEDAEVDAAAGLDALRQLVVVPLKLDDSTRRLLVSPAGVLSYVPFAPLLPDHEVVYVPSGTTYEVLRDDRAPHGARVLALGDPHYAGKMPALPSARQEAEAVGQVHLLGKDACIARLEQTLAAEEGGWRAVHFACHGLMDLEHPTLSSLALAGDDRLSVLDVFRMRIPADLVVLSACETGKGKVHRAEGIVGFTRAFMLAGAPRVLVSLWKVDDEATHALMVKFYELWAPRAEPQGTGQCPKSGAGGAQPRGLGAAAALRRAQAYVRDFKDESGKQKWKHPYYWAAWVLWGLPD
ncbi:MAG: tetratricopeptide repeat protein [Planctomycetota bacterium]|nr:tetratricopeptide repeat protein [Planctomycetota bacterium]